MYSTNVPILTWYVVCTSTGTSAIFLAILNAVTWSYTTAPTAVTTAYAYSSATAAIYAASNLAGLSTSSAAANINTNCAYGYFVQTGSGLSYVAAG